MESICAGAVEDRRADIILFRLSTDVKAWGTIRGNIATLPEVRRTSGTADWSVRAESP